MSGNYKERLTALFQKYDPGKVGDVDKMLKKFEGKEPALIKTLVNRYGPEPTEGGTPASGSASGTPATTPRGPASPTSVGAGGGKASHKERLTALFQKYDAPKVGQVDQMLEKFKGKEEALIKKLVEKYGPEPSAGSAPATPRGNDAAAASSGGGSAPTTPRPNPGGKLSYKERMVAIYQKYEPSKLGQVDAALEKFKGKEEAVIKKLVEKYGPEPTGDVAPAPADGGSASATPVQTPRGATGAATAKSHEERLRALFQKYAPAKVGTEKQMLEKFKGKEEALIKKLVSNYGPEPTDDAPSAPAPSADSGAATPAQTPRGEMPPPPPAAKTYKERMVAIYQKYEPSKLGQVDAALEKFKGKEEAVIKKLVEKYGPEPTGDVAPAPADGGSASATPVATPRAPKTHEERLRALFQKYAPAKVGTEKQMLEKFKGKEEALIKKLVSNYGPEPTDDAPPPADGSGSGTPAVENNSLVSPPATPRERSRSHYDRLKAMYAKYEPSKVGQVDAHLKKVAGKEEALIKKLVSKHGPEPEEDEEAETPSSSSAPPPAAQPASPSPKRAKGVSFAGLDPPSKEKNDDNDDTDEKAAEAPPPAADAPAAADDDEDPLLDDGDDEPADEASASAKSLTAAAVPTPDPAALRPQPSMEAPPKVDMAKSEDGKKLIAKLDRLAKQRDTLLVSSVLEKSTQIHNRMLRQQTFALWHRFASKKAAQKEAEAEVAANRWRKETIEREVEVTEEVMEEQEVEVETPAPATESKEGGEAKPEDDADKPPQPREKQTKKIQVPKKITKMVKETVTVYVPVPPSADELAGAGAADVSPFVDDLQREVVASHLRAMGFFRPAYEDIAAQASEGGSAQATPATSAASATTTDLVAAIEERKAVCASLGLSAANLRRISQLPTASFRGTMPPTEGQIAQTFSDASDALLKQLPGLLRRVDNLEREKAANAASFDQMEQTYQAAVEREAATKSELDRERALRVECEGDIEQLKADATERIQEVHQIHETMSQLRRELNEERRGIPSDIERQLTAKDELATHLHKELARLRNAHRSLKQKHELVTEELETERRRAARRLQRGANANRLLFSSSSSPTNGGGVGASPTSARAYRQPNAPGHIAPIVAPSASAAASMQQQYAIAQSQNEDLVAAARHSGRGHSQRHRKASSNDNEGEAEMVAMSEDEGEGGGDNKHQPKEDSDLEELQNEGEAAHHEDDGLVDDDQEFAPAQEEEGGASNTRQGGQMIAAAAADNSTDASSDHLDRDPYYDVQQSSPARGPCPNCNLRLTSFHGDRVGGEDGDKVAFCFSCRRAFTRKDLHIRDIRLSQKKTLEGTPRFGSNTQHSGWK